MTAPIQLRWLKAAELAARVYVFIFLNIYGLGKMAGGQFYRAGQLPEFIALKPAGELTGFELAWLFFGYSEFYIYFIGITQVAGAFLLLWNRTKLLGAMLLFPVLLNIIIVDVCFGISDGAMYSAVIYLLLLVFMLLLNRQQVKTVFQQMTAAQPREEGPVWWTVVLAGLMVVLLFLVEVFVIRKG